MTNEHPRSWFCACDHTDCVSSTEMEAIANEASERVFFVGAVCGFGLAVLIGGVLVAVWTVAS